jgi:hypothetical protein
LEKAEEECLADSEARARRRKRAAERRAELDRQMAVIAHIRHAETDYDALLARGFDRLEARALVAGTMDYILTTWESSEQADKRLS